MSVPHGGRDASLTLATERLIRRRAGTAAPDGATPLWNARHLKLDGVSCFRAASAAQQASVLDHCAKALLRESWFIEQSGIAYCARMVLTATSNAEQRLYAVIGGDEATHALWLSPWLAPSGLHPDPFSEFVTSLAGSGKPQPLAYLLQIVLEGYGITHYHALANGCGDAALAKTFVCIARDEALHHGGGLALFEAVRLSSADMRYVIDSTHVFLCALRNGPQAVVSALDQVIGLDQEAAVEQAFNELDAPGNSSRKLMQLRQLMAQPGMEAVVEEMADGGLFAPCSAAECARIYVASR